ncbi:MAG: RnfABCDGE type electron transport complex subunit D [Planctomycetes bacterium]|nr:RnfABCDGE type electron transport complex subunit D [Planctomycetota bacterium]
MKLVSSLIGKLHNVRALNKMKPLIDAMDAGILGPEDLTEGRPHLVDNVDIKRYMSMVILALVPATLASILFYRWDAIRLIAISYIVGGTVEVIFAIIRKHDIHEGFLITGLIFPLVLPPSTPSWIVAVGVVFGTMFGKEMFGGTGRNIFNPALVGRLFITIAFPATMTTNWKMPFAAADAVTVATPLSAFKTEGITASFTDLLIGNTAGSMGETCRIVIILGGIFLILTKVSNWRVPVCYISTVFLFALIGNHFLPERIAPPVFQVFAGGLLFGAFFMATDPVTSPFTRTGKYIFGISCGILTVLIRSFSGYVEGVMFSIVIMNAFNPLIDQIVLMFKYRPAKA